MKQRFLLSLFFACSFMITTRAQVSKGATWIGGTIGYNNGTDYNGAQDVSNEVSTFITTPAIGKVIKDNLVIGIGLTYRAITTDYSTSSDQSLTKDKYYGGGIFVRQYIPVIGRLYFFGDANAGISIIKGDGDYTYFPSGAKTGSTVKGWSAGLNITPGLSYGVTKKLQLETSFYNLLGISYLENKATSDNGNSRKLDRVIAGIHTDDQFQFNIGCRILLNNKG